jgi:uncharacterized oxidoreductase
MKMRGNTVLITGGASGLGYAMAEAFLAGGNEVLICGRREERLSEAKKSHPEFHTLACDLADEAGRAALLDWVSSDFHALNILVNNAGVQRDIDFTRGLDEFLAGPNEITINLEAPIALSGLFIPLLTGREGAAIVNVSSGLGFVPAARMPVYSATKAGLHAFSMALRHQLKTLGIQVFEVVPPAVDTELNPEGRAKRGGYKVELKPREFTEAVMKGFADDIFEIGYGMTALSIRASREDLDRSFQQMNGRW